MDIKESNPIQSQSLISCGEYVLICVFYRFSISERKNVFIEYHNVVPQNRSLFNNAQSYSHSGRSQLDYKWWRNIVPAESINRNRFWTMRQPKRLRCWKILQQSKHHHHVFLLCFRRDHSANLKDIIKGSQENSAHVCVKK